MEEGQDMLGGDATQDAVQEKNMTQNHQNLWKNKYVIPIDFVSIFCVYFLRLGVGGAARAAVYF